MNEDITHIAHISAVFDIGAILGSIILGHMTDFCYSKRSPIIIIAIIVSTIVSSYLTVNYYVISLK
jgi:sugar phosphate permease